MNRQQTKACLEKDFQNVCNRIKSANLSAKEMNRLTLILTRARLLEAGKRYSRNILLPVIILVVVWHCSDTFQWIMSAFGRLLLIRLLPYWNWTNLDHQDCLIEYPFKAFFSDPFEGYHDLDRSVPETDDDCILCEKIGKKWSRLLF